MLQSQNPQRKKKTKLQNGNQQKKISNFEYEQKKQSIQIRSINTLLDLT